MKTRIQTWWTHLTWPQVVLAVACLAGCGLLVQHVPVDVTQAYLTLAVGVSGVVGSLLNGKLPAPPPAPAVSDDPPA